MKARSGLATAVAMMATLVQPAVHAGDIDTDAVLGGALGGGAGAAIGSAVGGREGAIIGGALGGAAGTAISTSGEDESHKRYPVRSYDHDDDREWHDNGLHLGHYKHKHKHRKHKH